MATDVNIARRFAGQLWGEVQVQEKSADGIWWFSCSGHGGYIVDTNKYPVLDRGYKKLKDGREYKVDIVYIRYGSCKYYPDEQHFAAYEEDCDYLIVWWLIPEVRKKGYKNYLKYSEKNNLSYEDWWDGHKEGVLQSLKEYYPEFVKKYPEPVL